MIEVAHTVASFAPVTAALARTMQWLAGEVPTATIATDAFGPAGNLVIMDADGTVLGRIDLCDGYYTPESTVPGAGDTGG